MIEVTVAAEVFYPEVSHTAPISVAKPVEGKGSLQVHSIEEFRKKNTPPVPVNPLRSSRKRAGEQEAVCNWEVDITFGLNKQKGTAMVHRTNEGRLFVHLARKGGFTPVFIDNPALAYA